MLTLTEIFTIIIVHWVADFLMQDEKWAIGKSKNWEDLLNHTFTYSFIWLFTGIIIYLQHFKPYNGGLDIGYENYIFPGLLFVLITLITHTITDYFTSRIVSKKFAKGEYGSSIPNTGGFTIIGLDQVLHYIQLFTTYYYLKQ